jgi:lipoprotein-releasing system permease protein
MSFEFFLGKRYLITKQKEAFVSLITLLSTFGVTVGVMVLIVVIAVMTGFETELMHRILNIESHILVGRYGTISIGRLHCGIAGYFSCKLWLSTQNDC